MAIKPTECLGIPNSVHKKIDRVEEIADEELSAKYDHRTNSGAPIVVSTGHRLTEDMKALLEKRYPDWMIRYDLHGQTTETVAIFTPIPVKAEKKETGNGKQ